MRLGSRLHRRALRSATLAGGALGLALLAAACAPAPDEEEWAAAEALDAADDYRQTGGDVGVEPVCPACRLILEPAAELHLPGTVQDTPGFGHVAADSTRVWISLPGLEAPLLVYGHDGVQSAAVRAAAGQPLAAPLILLPDATDSLHVLQRSPARYVLLGPTLEVVRSHELPVPPSYAAVFSADRLVVAAPFRTPRDVRRLQYLDREGAYVNTFDAVSLEDSANTGRIPARHMGRIGRLFTLSDSGFALTRFRGASAGHHFTAERPWGLPAVGPEAARPLGLTTIGVERATAAGPRTSYRVLVFGHADGAGAATETRIDALHPFSMRVIARQTVAGRVMPMPNGWAYRLSPHAAGGTRLELFRLRLEGDPTR
ncbi:MAG: hypothetical protein WEA24_09625 [Gemmatimonadota bacterium]